MRLDPIEDLYLETFLGCEWNDSDGTSAYILNLDDTRACMLLG